MAKEKEFSIKEDTMWQLFEASEAVRRAENAFNWAEEDYIETAITELRVAELKLSAISQKMKLAYLK